MREAVCWGRESGWHTPRRAPRPCSTEWVPPAERESEHRAVVLCTASTIKSIQLKLLEKMDLLRDTRRKQHPSMEVDLRALVEVMSVYDKSCLIMDEVDLLLHPLKSELNFPIGKKHALDVSPQRWQDFASLMFSTSFQRRNGASLRCVLWPHW